jgi:hypothetical protein
MIYIQNFLQVISPSDAMQNPKSQVLYPILKKATELETDEYWKPIFEQLSMGKCTNKCIYISNNNILSANKRKQFSFPLLQDASDGNEEEDVAKFLEKIKKFLMTNTNLYSNIDNNKRKEVLNQKIDKKSIIKWSDAKKKNIKKQLTMNFVLNMKTKYNMTMDAAKELSNIIFYAFKDKTHSSDDVNFENDEIESISDIEYDPNLKKFVNNRDLEECEEKVCEENNTKYLVYYWDKHVNACNKM